VRKNWDGKGQPFTLEAAPLQLKAKAKKITNWKLDPQYKLAGTLQLSPAKSDEPEETVTLVPMGCARLRIASFPTIGQGPDAKEWVYKEPVLASFVHDNVSALNDGKIPSSSNDHSIPRFTWWDHKGTTEFVEYRFEAGRKISAAEVYWFDDSPEGQCRVPASWRLLYQVPAREMDKAGEWQPVDVVEGEYGAKPNQVNRVKFKPVQSRGLRLEVQLQKDYSGGVLEWKVE
jgi:hypothetical protein